MIYTILLLVALLGSTIEITGISTKYAIISNRYFFISLFFVGVGGLTKTNGLDVDAYLSIFSNDDIGEIGQFEPLFLLLCNCFPSYEVFIFVFVIINLNLISGTIKRYSPYVCLSVFIYISEYYLLGLMGQIRQAIAISIMIYAWRYFGERKILLWGVIASLFHYSAVICCLFYIIPNKLRSLNFYVLVITVAVFIYMPMQGFIMNLLVNIVGNSLGIVGGKVALYLSTASTNISIPYLMYKLSFFFLLLWKRNSLSCMPFFPKLLNIYVVSVIMWLFLSFSGSLGGRLSMYFSITEILLLPYLFWGFRKSQLKILIYPVFMALCVYQYYSFLYEYAFVFLPYKSIFS